MTDTRRPKAIENDSPLAEGFVAFSGVLRFAKDGFRVRGVTFEDSDGARAFKGDAGRLQDSVGAIVRITADLKWVGEEAKPKSGEVIEQKRSGPYFYATRLVAIEVVKQVEILEGPLGRSKGMYQVQGRLFSEEDFAWALGVQGVRVGDKVRLFGQSKTYVCPPDVQCLTTGAIPLFDIGRGEKL